MRNVTTLSFLIAFLFVGSAFAQELEYSLSPAGAELSDPFPVGVQNGARGVSGPFDMDGDGNVEILVAQHAGGGGRIHVIENQGVDSWEHVYTTAIIDSSANDNNARYATAADLDGDGLMEIVYVAGAGYDTEKDPVLGIGVYVWEHDGGTDDFYGDYPATIGQFQEIQTLDPSPVHAQKLAAEDIDGDERQELLVPANGVSAVDFFYVLSVSGDYETGTAGETFETWIIESAQSPRENTGIWGSGSPMDMLPGDFNGDGMTDISYHSWNNYNFFNGTVTGVNEVTLPNETTENPHIHATAPDDQTGLFGGTVVDLDGDGTDEAVYTNFHSNNLAVLDYDQDQDVLSITSEELVIDVVEDAGWGGIDSGDFDGDGFVDVLVGGAGYAPSNYNDGEPSRFLNVAEFLGGDPTDPSNWTLDEIDTGHELDTTAFNIVYRDSLGETSKYFTTAFAKQGVTDTSGTASENVFPSGVAFLGDADGDGMNEVALSFQGVDDSLVVFDEVWNEDSEEYDLSVREIIEAPARSFVRIYEFPSDFSVAVDDGAGLPEGFKLHANYPNPFNPSTTIGFTIPGQASVTLRVYDATGRVINTLISNRNYGVGTYEVTWNGDTTSGQSVASGTYFYSLEYDGHRIVRPMVLVK